MKPIQKFLRFAPLLALMPACTEISNIPPVAVLEAPSTVRVNRPAAFDASHSRDADGTLLTYKFDFGDGSPSLKNTAAAAHTFAKTGTFLTTLTVKDSAGASAIARVQVIVTENAPPTALFLAPETALTGQTIRIDTVDSSDSDGRIVSRKIEFGDGTEAESDAASKEYGAAGTYQIKVTVTDDEGATSTATRDIRIFTPFEAAIMPTAQFTAPSIIGTRTVATFDGSASTPGSGAISAYNWSLGDGRVMSGPSVVNVSYTAAGTYYVALTVTSTTGRASSVIRQVMVRDLYVSLSSMQPATGSMNGGVFVVLTGTNLDAGIPFITFGGVPGTNITVLDPNHVSVQAPAALVAGVVDVQVTNDAGTSILTRVFTYTGGGQTAGSGSGWVDSTTGGTALGLPAKSDDVTTGIALPFDFTFYGRFYPAGSLLYVSTNGWASPESASLQPGKASIPSSFNPSPLLAPFFMDLSTSTLGGSDIYYKVTGSAPARVFTVAWVNFTDVANGSGAAPFTFELSIYEGSGDVKFQYENTYGATYAAGEAALIGIQGDPITGTQVSNNSFVPGLAPGGRTFVFHNTPAGYGLEVGGTLTVAMATPGEASQQNTALAPAWTVVFSNPVVPTSVIAGITLKITDTTESVEVTPTLVWNTAGDTLSVTLDNEADVWRGHAYTLYLNTSVKDVLGQYLNQTPLSTPAAGFATSLSTPRYGKLASGTANGCCAHRIAWNSTRQQALVIGQGDSDFNWFDAQAQRTRSGTVFNNTADAVAIEPTGQYGFIVGDDLLRVTPGGSRLSLDNGNNGFSGQSYGVTASTSNVVYSDYWGPNLETIAFDGNSVNTSTGFGTVCAVNAGRPVGVARDTAGTVYTFTSNRRVLSFSSNLGTCNWVTAAMGSFSYYGQIAVRGTSDVWVASGTSGLYVYNASTGAALSGSPLAGGSLSNVQDVAFSADLAWAFATNPSTKRIVVINASTRAVVGSYQLDGANSVDYLAPIAQMSGSVQPKVRLLVTSSSDDELIMTQ